MTETEPLILRRWSSVIRTKDRVAYAAYVEKTGGSSMDALRGFTGDAPELARYYPEDDRYLLEKPEFVEHYTVVAGTVPPDRVT